MKKTIKRVGSFKATDDAGTVHEIDIYQTFITTITTEGSSVVPGVKELRMSNGWNVNRLGNGKYQIVQTKQNLQSNDPNAP